MSGAWKQETRGRQTVQRLDTVLQALNQCAIVGETDAQGRITFANDKFIEISKYQIDELLGVDHRIVNSGHHPKSFFRDLWSTIAAGKTWRGEICNRAKDGSTYWVDTAIAPILGEEGPPEGYFSVQLDISDRKCRAEELEASHAMRGEQARCLIALVDFSQRLGNVETEEEILREALAAAVTITCVSQSAIFVQHGVESVRVLVGPDDDGIQYDRLCSVAKQAIVAARIVSGGEPSEHASPLELERPVETVREFWVPIRAAGRSPAVLYLAAKDTGRKFADADIEILDILSNLAASERAKMSSASAVESMRDALVIALARLAEFRDLNTGRHLERVTQYATMLAGELMHDGHPEVDEEFLGALRRAMPLHDVGKIGVPDAILKKPGRLTDAERRAMNEHAEAGARVVRTIIASTPEAGFLALAEVIAQSHHEWYDGTGYPDRLAGAAIPLAGRIASVADVYDAMRTERPYKQAFPHDEVVRMIQGQSGSQFDPVVVEAFLRLADEFREVSETLSDQ